MQTYMERETDRGQQKHGLAPGLRLDRVVSFNIVPLAPWKTSEYISPEASIALTCLREQP